MFRDIFNNAYLPYRDPETLRAFLKIIDEFTYDHSERLGDAFEYLLSVLGSQGDAGQFRTPRHIIDFIVAVIDPKKGETVLDPACGTAGFLISSYKHILAANTDPQGDSTLTPDDKGRLAVNFKGYDISPDMVRLSLVNLYLHGFADPHIFEYDTLTSEERWNEYADVILANPPFMSPKGGIRPHNRFSVQSKRSEVLFVDYMAEHLTPSGRAGIIVPEGIIFQSQTAYRHLRKMLVEEYLVAVVSLPAGVFNPYSGVKTSILILDKSLAKKTDRIGFFKVENDGFDLGAQRRPIDKNDLPKAQAEIAEYLRRLRAGETLGDFEPALGRLAEKEKIAANEEYNLSGERYRETREKNHIFPLVKIGDVCTINPRKSCLDDLNTETRVSFVPMADLNKYQMTFRSRGEKLLSEVSASYTYFADNDVLLAKVTPCFENGKAGIARGLTNGIGFGSSEFYVLRCTEKLLSEWIYFCVTHPQFRDPAIAQMTGTGGLHRVPRNYVNNFKIPLPPLDAQKEIVAEIEGYQKVIDGARAVVDNYRPHIPIDPDWPMVQLNDVYKSIRNGYNVRQTDEQRRFKVTRIQTIADGTVDLGKTKWTDDDVPDDRFMRTGDILFSHINSEVHLGKTAIFTQSTVPVVHGINLVCLRPRQDLIEPFFALWIMKHDHFVRKVRSLAQRAVNQASVKLTDLRKIAIPLPPLDVQKEIVAEIKAEQTTVDATRDLIARFERKISATIGRVWGEDKMTGV